MENIFLKYRTWFKSNKPKLTKLQIPGWAGCAQNRKDGAIPQPWHCLPFIEASRQLEICWMFDTELQISVDENNKLKIVGDFSKEDTKGYFDGPPIKTFAPGHYGVTSGLDLMPPPNYIVRLEPHMRYFTDTTNTVPCAVPGHIQNEWWPKIFFVVMKFPPLGHTHIFRKNEPFAQILILPKEVKYDIQEMSLEEMQKRIFRDQAISKLDIGTTWKDNLGNPFNDKYKVLSKIFNEGGIEAVDKFLKEAQDKFSEEKLKKEEKSRKKLKRRLL